MIFLLNHLLFSFQKKNEPFILSVGNGTEKIVEKLNAKKNMEVIRIRHYSPGENEVFERLMNLKMNPHEDAINLNYLNNCDYTSKMIRLKIKELIHLSADLLQKAAIFVLNPSELISKCFIKELIHYQQEREIKIKGTIILVQSKNTFLDYKLNALFYAAECKEQFEQVRTINDCTNTKLKTI